MRAALKAAAIDGDNIDVIEAHGTATALGDPTELNALLEVYCRTPRTKPLVVGSVKTNFGHMEASAGIVGFIKLLLSLRHEYLPQHLNYSEGHPDINWANEAIEVCAQGKPWPKSQRRRVAGLSGFGFSGTNAHVILAEAPETVPASSAIGAKAADAAAPDEKQQQDQQLLMLSAATPASLNQAAATLADWMENHPDMSLGRICHTWATRRKRQVNRLTVVSDDREQVIAKLRRFTEAGKAKGCSSGTAQSRSGRLSVAMVCGGHGAQYGGMSATLYQTEPEFRAAFDRASAIASQYCDSDLSALIHAAPEKTANKIFEGNKVAGDLGRTLQAQLAIFCVQYGLAQQWRAWGIEPKALLGHSLGEYTAACLAGVFSLEDAIMLIAERARLMDAHTPPGAMLTAFHDEAAVQGIVADYADASIAAVNGPGIILVAGTAKSIADIACSIDADGGRTTSVPIDRAFHSPLVDAVLPHFRRVLERVRFSSPKIPLISNLTGALADQDITTVDYWLRHSRAPVQFMKGMQTLHAAKYDAFIDLSPEPVMMGLDLCFQEIRDAVGSKGVWVPSLRNGADDQARMLESLGRLYCLGLNPARAESAEIPVRLPTYRFDRQRCWSAAAERGQHASAANAAVAGEVSANAAPNPKPAVVNTAGAHDIHRVMLEHMAVVDQYLTLTEGNR